MDVEKLLSSVKTFVGLCESYEWLKKANNEQLKTAFKLGLFIEKTVVILSEKGLNDKADSVFKKWAEINKQRVDRYAFGNLAKSCDALLKVILCDQTISFNVTDSALRIYTSMLPPERFENLLTKIILENKSLKEITKNIFVGDLNEIVLEANALLFEFTQDVRNGDFIKIKSSINSILGDHNFPKSLSVLFKILVIEDNCYNQDEMKEVKNIIFVEIEDLLIDRSALNKEIWLFIFSILPKDDLDIICKNNNKIVDLIFNFLVYIGSMMVFKFNKWVVDPNISLYEVEYGNIIDTLRILIGVNQEIRSDIFTKLSTLTNNHELWRNVTNDL